MKKMTIETPTVGIGYHAFITYCLKAYIPFYYVLPDGITYDSYGFLGTLFFCLYILFKNIVINRLLLK